MWGLVHRHRPIKLNFSETMRIRDSHQGSAKKMKSIEEEEEEATSELIVDRSVDFAYKSCKQFQFSHGLGSCRHSVCTPTASFRFRFDSSFHWFYASISTFCDTDSGASALKPNSKTPFEPKTRWKCVVCFFNINFCTTKKRERNAHNSQL